MPRKKKRKSGEEPTEHYVVPLTGWEFSYSFGLNRSRHFPGVYTEYALLELIGTLHCPLSKQTAGVTRVELTLSGSDELDEEPHSEPPTAIGMLDKHGDVLRAYVWMPAKRMGEVVTAATTNRLKMADFLGTKLRYRKARIWSISVSTEFDPDEY